MKFLPIASLALVLALSGCSNAETEISPQQKRNNFDACVIQWFKDTGNNYKEEGFFYGLAVKECSFHLETNP